MPLPSVSVDFIAANQETRADNALPGTDKQKHLEQIRKDIREFKAANGLDKVIVLWTATERFASVQSVSTTRRSALLAAIKSNEPEIALRPSLRSRRFWRDRSTSTSPQNTLPPVSSSPSSTT